MAEVIDNHTENLAEVLAQGTNLRRLLAAGIIHQLSEVGTDHLGGGLPGFIG
ncbi:hypothetical protein D3C76_1878040 [compost metagenome]